MDLLQELAWCAGEECGALRDVEDFGAEFRYTFEVQIM